MLYLSFTFVQFKNNNIHYECNVKKKGEEDEKQKKNKEKNNNKMRRNRMQIFFVSYTQVPSVRGQLGATRTHLYVTL